MSTFLFANNWLTTLASPAGSTDTTLTFSENVPTIGAGQILPITLNDAATGAVFEIVYATANSGANATVIRGQEGTSAVSWLAADNAYAPGATKGVLAAMQQTNVPITTNSPLQFVNVAADTKANFSTYTQINTTSFTIPAGALSQGAVLEISGSGSFAVGAPTTLALEVQVGGQVFSQIIHPSSVPYSVSGPTGAFLFSVSAACTVAGTSGNLSVVSGYYALRDFNTANPAYLSGTFTTSVNTTIGNAVRILAQYGAASSSNTLTLEAWSVNILYPQTVVT